MKRIPASEPLRQPAEAFRPANLALVGEVGGGQMRKQAFALNRLAVNLGMSVGPALGGFLAMVSFPLLSWVDGATSLLAGLLLLVAPIEVPPRPASAPAPFQPRLPRLASLLPDRRMGYFLVAVLASLLVFFLHVGAYPLFLVRRLGLPEAFFGLTYMLNTVLIVLFEVRLTGATAHWPLRRALGVGAALSALGFGAHVVAHDAWAVLAAVVVWTAGEMILFPTASAYVAEITPPGAAASTWGCT
jgi:MFS family permease